MKPYRIAYIVALAIIAGSLAACVTTTTTMPDGTVIKSSGPSPGSVEAATAVALVVASSQVHAEK